MDTLFNWFALSLIMLFVIITSLGVFCVIRGQFRMQRKFAKRSTMPFDDWFARHYQDLGDRWRESVEKIAGIFADEVGVDPTQLDPADGVMDDYTSQGIAGCMDMDWDVFLLRMGEYVEDTIGRKLTAQERTTCSQWRTLDDYIRGIIELFEKSASPASNPHN